MQAALASMEAALASMEAAATELTVFRSLRHDAANQAKENWF
jgi:hypothetical protein